MFVIVSITNIGNVPHKALRGRIISEWRFGRDMEGSGLRPIRDNITAFT